MIRLKGIDHIVLRVRDARAMSDFYCKVIGCVEARQTGSGLTQLRAGASVIDLVTVDDPTGARRGQEGHNVDHFCLAVEDFDIAAVADYIRAHGVAIEKITSRGSIFLDDPEGNRLELTGQTERRA
jgi:glyoxylase I family protein